MSDKTLFTAILRPATGSFNLLDRTVSDSSYLSENQNLVDQTVSSSMDEATKGATLLAMFGAGAVSRFTRAGVMSMALGEGALLPIMARGGSYAIALANESATFVGIERGFHPSQTSFEKDWARAFINLGSLKLLGTAGEGQNLLLQHLMTDLGMVGGQQLGAKFGLVEKPQGSLAQQMVQAEALNWSQKGGMALLHGLSPNLLPMEKSMDLYLQSRGTDLFSMEQTLPFFSKVLPATAGYSSDGLAAIEARPDAKTENLFQIGSLKGAGGLGPWEDPQEDSIGKWIVRLMGLAHEGNKTATRILSEMLEDPDPSKRLLVASALDLIKKPGEGSAVKKVSKDPDVRIQAVRALGKLGGDEARSILKEAFSDPDPWVRMQIVLTLGELGGAADSPILKEALNDPDPMVRIQTVLVFEKLNTPAALVVIAKALNDANSDVRWAAVAALGRSGYRALASTLEEVLRNDPHPGVRSSAALALGRLGDRASRPVLERALRDPDSRVRAAAVQALILLEEKVDVGGEVATR